MIDPQVNQWHIRFSWWCSSDACVLCPVACRYLTLFARHLRRLALLFHRYILGPFMASRPLVPTICLQPYVIWGQMEEQCRGRPHDHCSHLELYVALSHRIMQYCGSTGFAVHRTTVLLHLVPCPHCVLTILSFLHDMEVSIIMGYLKKELFSAELKRYRAVR